MIEYKISVIIPTYKPQAYLWECLESINRQTLNKNSFEVILVLNGCNEPYNSQIISWKEAHSCINFNYIQTDQGGVSNARNLALDKAQGEFITFIDDDDYISTSYLKELLDNADKDTVSLCYPLSFDDGTTKFEEYYITGDYNRNFKKNACDINATKKFFSGPVYKLIHRDIIGNRRFDKSFVNGEDSIFMFLISDQIKKISFTSKNAVYYRRLRHGSALSKKKSRKYVVKNQFRMMVEYSKIFFSSPSKYNFEFYITRLLAAIHGAIEQFGLFFK